MGCVVLLCFGNILSAYLFAYATRSGCAYTNTNTEEQIIKVDNEDLAGLLFDAKNATKQCHEFKGPPVKTNA